MHSYLRAIGFSKIKSRNELDQIIGTIMESPDDKRVLPLSAKHRFVQFSKDFADNVGISIRGEYDEKGFFHLEHYYPYGIGQMISSKEIVMINKRVDTDAYTGMCDDMRLGVSLIFYLQNMVDYLKSNASGNTGRLVNISLSALSLEGKVLLGVNNNKTSSHKMNTESSLRNKLIAEAHNGDQEAIDNLTIDELDVFAMINRRMKTEDVYSLVESSFIPYGSESDNYTIIGTIMNWHTITNSYSQEAVYCLLINCNDLTFPVYINSNDIVGEPMIGRRFKGVIWMQGNVDFAEI